MKPRVLVIFATSYGQTEKIARRIAATLERNEITVELCDAGKTRPAMATEQYSAILVGSSIIAKGHQPAFRTKNEAGVQPAHEFVEVLEAREPRLPVADNRGVGRIHEYSAAIAQTDNRGRTARPDIDVGYTPWRVFRFHTRHDQLRIRRPVERRNLRDRVQPAREWGPEGQVGAGD